MRTVFIIFIGFHGLIHILGFVKAFELAEIKELTAPISKSFGMLWLAALLLITIAVLLYALKNNYWWLFGIASVLISQTLIIYFWQDAKFGTLPNIILLIVSIVAFGEFNFKGTVNEEISELLSKIDKKSSKIITEDMTSGLPAPVQKWLNNSGIVGKEEIKNVFLKQKVLMKMKPDQEDWSDATAEQYFNAQTPAFIWKVNMQMMPFISLAGRDKFENGKGEMLIKVLSLLPVVDEKENEKINISTLQRYLAEIVWFPSTALNPSVSWEEINDFSAKATMNYNGTMGSGVFYFDEDGNFTKFSAMRYMSGEENAELREWIVEVKESKVMEGIKIPVKIHAIWNLDEGEWNWLQLELTYIKYD